VRKWYFVGVDGPDIAWAENPESGFKFDSEKAAKMDCQLLNSGHHFITPYRGGSRLLIRNFRVEEVPPNFIICFDVEPESGSSWSDIGD
jgi:hypothetical protein